MATETRGRPAKLFRFRRDVVAERAVDGKQAAAGAVRPDPRSTGFGRFSVQQPSP